MRLHTYILSCGHMRGITSFKPKFVGSKISCYECPRTPRHDSPAPIRQILALAPEV